MYMFTKHASMVSALAMMTIGAAGLASAQSNNNENRRGGCDANMEDCSPRDAMRQRGVNDGDSDRRRARNNDNNDDSDRRRTGNNDGDEDKVTRSDKENRKVRESRADWRFDSNRHERRRDRDDRFRFHFGGFWYPEPYWLGYGLAVNPRVSCSEGRAIVRDRGFNRVRTVECSGRTFTYLGRRSGDTFRVILNSRTGRIVDIDRT